LPLRRLDFVAKAENFMVCFWSTTLLGCEEWEQLPSLVQQATSTRKVQSSTTRSNIDRILLACYPLPRHQM
jgi:hypothetical protein